MAVNRLLAHLWLPGMELLYADFSGQAFGRHSHPAFAISSTLHGIGDCQYRGQRYALPASTLSLMNPEEPYTGHAESERLVYRMFYAEETRLLDLLGRKQLPRGFDELNPVDGDSVTIGLARLAEDFQRSDTLGLESRLLALFEQVFAHHGGLRLAAAAPRDGGTTTRLRDYLETHATEALGLDQLAQLLQRHPRHLIEAFQRAYGMPPHTYRLQCRVRQVKRLLLEERLLAELAQHPGFYDQAHFSTILRRLTGVTPGQFRRSARTWVFSNTAPVALHRLEAFAFREAFMLAAFILVANTHLAALLSPGPNFFLLVHAALLRGRRQADRVAIGIALANFLSMLLVLGLLVSVPDSAHSVLRQLQALGGLYFLRLAGQTLLARRRLEIPVRRDILSRGGYLCGLRDGLLASGLSPELPILYAGLSGVLVRSDLPGWALALCLAWMSLAMPCWGIALVRLLDGPRWRGWLQRQVSALDRLCGVLLLALGGWLVLATL